MEFDFSIEFKQGNADLAADALSRQDMADRNAISTITPESDLMDRIKLSWQQNIHLQQIIQELQVNAGSHRHYTWQQDVLPRKGRLVVGKNDNLQKDNLLWIHSTAAGGSFRKRCYFEEVASYRLLGSNDKRCQI